MKHWPAVNFLILLLLAVVILAATAPLVWNSPLAPYLYPDPISSPPAAAESGAVVSCEQDIRGKEWHAEIEVAQVAVGMVTAVDVLVHPPGGPVSWYETQITLDDGQTFLFHGKPPTDLIRVGAFLQITFRPAKIISVYELEPEK